MKKLFILPVLLIAAFALLGCGSSDKDDESASIFDDRESLIGFSAISSIMTLHNSLDETTMNQSQFKHLSTHNQEDTFAILSEIDDLTPYLDLVTTFMGSGNNFDVSVSASSHEDYEHRMIITTVDMDGVKINYTLHYNETFVDADDEDFDPEETDSELEGIMVIDGITYTLYGERQVDQGEESLELIASLDAENYVTLDYEIEIDAEEHSIEFDYEVFKDNQLVMSVEIQFEKDAEETELSLKFLRGNRESEYSFEIEIDGDKRTIEIEYKITEAGTVIEEGEAEVKITYNADTDAYVIRYEIETQGQQVAVDVEYPRSN